MKVTLPFFAQFSIYRMTTQQIHYSGACRDGVHFKAHGGTPNDAY